MRIILKPNDKDKHMIEIWDMEGNLFAAVHVDLFYDSHESGGDLYAVLDGGESIAVSLKIDEFNPSFIEPRSDYQGRRNYDQRTN